MISGRRGEGRGKVGQGDGERGGVGEGERKRRRGEGEGEEGEGVQKEVVGIGVYSDIGDKDASRGDVGRAVNMIRTDCYIINDKVD